METPNRRSARLVNRSAVVSWACRSCWSGARLWLLRDPVQRQNW